MTVVAWMLYTLVIGALLALTARGFEEVCRIAGRPSRWAWMGALALTVVLAALAPRRTITLFRAAPVLAVPASLVPSAARSVPAAPRSMPQPSQAVQPETRPLTAVWSAVAATWERIPSAFNRYLALAWGTLSGLALLLLAAVHARFRWASRTWPAAELHGVRVRIAGIGGPAVVGVTQPEIIIPQWLLGRTKDEQRVVLAHEQEHLRARDPLLLATGCLAVALLPWHPAVWWMFSRLRLTVELDCDMRVLRRGIAPRVYGTLLIDMAARCSGFPIAAPALADTSSHLRQRLFAMKPLRLRFARARGSLAGGFALLCLLAACAAQVPVIAAQVPANDTSAAARTGTPNDSVSHAAAPGDSTRGTPVKPPHFRVRVTSVMPDSFATIVIVDGVRAVAGQKPVDPDMVEDIEVFKGPRAVRLYGADAANGVTVIRTKKARSANDSTAKADSVPRATPIHSLVELLDGRVPGMSVQHVSGTPGDSTQNVTGDPAKIRFRGIGSVARSNTNPLVILNGVRIEDMAFPDTATGLAHPLDQLDPNIIEKIEIFKGEEAVKLYGAGAVNGAIVVTTKAKKNP